MTLCACMTPKKVSKSPARSLDWKDLVLRVELRDSELNNQNVNTF